MRATLLLLLAACSGPAQVQEGDFRVVTAADLETLASYSEVTGSIGVYGTDATVVELPRLEVVGGSIDISENTSLTSVRLPALLSVGDSVQVQNNDRLLSLSMPAVESIADSLVIFGNDQIAVVEAPVLVELGRLFVAYNPALSMCDVDALAAQTGVADYVSAGNAPCR